MSCGCTFNDGRLVSACETHVAWLRDQVLMAPLGHTAATLNHVSPLREGDHGHFLCGLIFRDGRALMVHGLLTEQVLCNLHECAMKPAASQLEAAMRKPS